MIRKALTTDIGDIHKLLNRYANDGLLLPRALSELYDHLRDFYVLMDDQDKGVVIGACALGICWEDLAEIRSLVVSKDQQGNRFGAELVAACLDEARALGLKRVFTLTYIPEFFSKMGFREVEKSELPHKVWADCFKCTKFPDCDETAMILTL
jgi:amino-acid N-acetyltransferase